MKILISLFVTLFLLAGIGKAEAGVTTLPVEVRSAQGQTVFKPAYEKLLQAFAGIRNHERKNVVLIGYEVVETQDRNISVALHYGTTTDRWPTRIYGIGTITVKMRFFPDGIEGYISTGEAEFKPGEED